MGKPTTTVILGAGFGGIATANALRAALPKEHRVVLVDKRERFSIGAGFSWVMLGQARAEEVGRPLEPLKKKGIELIRSEVTSLDPATRKVRTAAGELTADFLVLALGAETELGSIPGLSSAHTFYTLDGAERLKGVLDTFKGGKLLLLVARTPFKCPPAPYETALLLKHRFPKADVSIHTPEPLPMATAGAEMGNKVKGLVEKAGIAFNPNRKVTSVDAAKRVVLFEGGAEASYDLLIAVPPHTAPKVVKDAGLLNEAGWVSVEPKSLQTKHPRVYAVGDVTGLPLPGRFKPEAALALPKAGVFAEAEGKVVAARIAAEVLGKTPDAAFNGVGFCYLETGDMHALRADGDFFAMPAPKMTAAKEPDLTQWQDKKAWVNGWLEKNL